MSDNNNEQMIRHCLQRMLENKEPSVCKYWWHRMAYYIKRRSPAQVMQMEQARGL